jgi:peptidoglycan/LPS O-acetylase OafA/YrhL
LPWLQGGFLGVDAFFVLSGYLITGLLLDEHSMAGRIDLGRFWLRRARRLLPALLVVVGVVAIWTSVAAVPFELALRRSDLLWTLFYGANWHFIESGQDYFAQFASPSPVLHTWSLAIEEQFYAFWPLITLAALRFGRGSSRAIVAVSAVGVVLSAVAMALLYDPGDPSRAYLGTDARIHELLIGALLAAALRAGVRPPRRLASVAAGGAILAILAAFVLVADDRAAYYFGGSVAFGAAVAALLWGIDTAPGAAVARVLSIAPMAWIGRISYGIYLWHWPMVLAFPSSPVVAVVLTAVAATMSFYLLEQPIRRGRLPLIGSSGRRFAAVAAAAACLLAATTVWATSAPPEEPAIIQEIAGCDSNTICVRHREADGAPVLAVVGDSIARSLDPAFLRIAERYRWTYVIAAPNGCRLDSLLTSYQGVARPQDRACTSLVPRLRAELIATWHPDLVIAHDRWEIIDVLAADGRVVKGGTPEHVDMTEVALKEVALEFRSAGARIVLIELPPILPAKCGTPEMVDRADCRRRVDADTVHEPYNALFRRVARSIPGVATISVVDAICPQGVCVPELRGNIVRPDGLHFAATAGSWLADVIDAELARASSRSLTP